MAGPGIIVRGNDLAGVVIAATPVERALNDVKVVLPAFGHVWAKALHHVVGVGTFEDAG